MGDHWAFATLFAAAASQEPHRILRWLFVAIAAVYALCGLEIGIIALPGFLASHVYG